MSKRSGNPVDADRRRVYKAFARCLESIAAQLRTNAGFEARAVVDHLRAHYREWTPTERRWGVQLEGGGGDGGDDNGVVDVATAGIWDSLRTKIQGAPALSFA